MKQLTEVLQSAASYYRQMLATSPAAVAYLNGRGISGEVAALFGLGFAPDAFQGLADVFSDYQSSQALVDTGLVTTSEAKRRYDRFRGRVMFPISNYSGEIIAFGGRVIEAHDGAPKYLNSPETEVFHKSDVLYGLHQARSAIVESGMTYVVEGYLDVVSLAQHGVRNAVATMGTATTSGHILELLLLAQRIVFCFDGDDAGRRAATKALEACRPFMRDDIDVSFMFLQGGHDPDSFVRKFGVDEFYAAAGRATPFERFFLACLVSTGFAIDSAEGKAALANASFPALREIRNAPDLLERLLVAIARQTGFSVNELVFLGGLENNF
jgi:DNA primase